jgi:hypothetical protein
MNNDSDVQIYELNNNMSDYGHSNNEYILNQIESEHENENNNTLQLS